MSDSQFAERLDALLGVQREQVGDLVWPDFSKPLSTKRNALFEGFTVRPREGISLALDGPRGGQVTVSHL